MENLIEGMPRLIQAGMGVYISSANLANAASRAGALGVVSGTALRHVVIEQVRSGDAQVIEIARTFPVQRYADELLSFAPGAAKTGIRFQSIIPTRATTRCPGGSVPSVPMLK
jgi:hypothetical protein